MKSPTLDDRKRVCERPDDAAVMYQKWKDLLFLHWELDPQEVQATLPEGLRVDLHEGHCYIGLVPFYMCDIRPRFLPTVPGISNFLEMNVRTYVHDRHGNPGVWFYSLDANQTLAVALAKKFFHLPYHNARMDAEQNDGGIAYQCSRKSRPEESSRFQYSGGAEVEKPEPGSLEYFLLERYLLFAHDRKQNRLLCGQVHHSPYPVQEAVVEHFEDTAIRQAGFDTNGDPPVHSAFSPGVSVDIFGIQEVAR